MIRLTHTLIFCLISSLCALAQSEQETYKVGDFNFLISSLALHPTGDTLAVGTQQGNPIYFCNPRTGEVYYEYDVDGYYAGPYISYSKTGKYVLFEQRFFLDYSPNKDQDVQFEVMNVQTGKMILRVSEAFDASISPDETQLAVIQKGSLLIYNIATGSLLTRLDDEGLGYAVAYNNEGTELYVSHKLDNGDIKNIPRLSRDKKAVKSALKYHQGIYVLNPTTLKKLTTFQESFDQVYDITLSSDLEHVFVKSKQHKKVNAAALTKCFITVANTSTKKVERATFYTGIEHPDYKDNGEVFLISTSGGSYAEHILQYKLATADVMGEFSRDVRWGEGLLKLDIQSSESKFVILHDGKTMVVSHGNKLYQETILK